jgi:hypothetical protein
MALLLPILGAFSACGGGSGSAPSSNWVGKTFLLDTPALPAANWTKPPGVGSDVGAYVPQFLIGVEAGTGNDLTITLTTALNGAQDPCSPTTQVTASGASYPDIQISAPTFPIHIVDTSPNHPNQVETTAHDVLFKNVLPGSSAAMDGELDATVDLAELYKLFYLVPNATKDSVCTTLQVQGGVSCEACAFNQQPYCLTLQASQIGATETPASITPVSVANIDPSCQ